MATQQGGHSGINTPTAPSSCSGSTFWCPPLAESNLKSETRFPVHAAHTHQPHRTRGGQRKDEWKILATCDMMLYKKCILSYSDEQNIFLRYLWFLLHFLKMLYSHKSEMGVFLLMGVTFGPHPRADLGQEDQPYD